jgi:hypothetical protein
VARDPEALADALAAVVAARQRSDGHLKVREFSAPRIAGCLRQIYEDALSDGSERKWNTSRC